MSQPAQAIQHLFSSHFNSRPAKVIQTGAIDLIVLHAISLPEGVFSFRYVEQLFMGTLGTQVHPSFSSLAGLRVSAHFVVERNGRIHQFVACQDRAWHAGVSSWQGRDDCNDYAIGIEMIGDRSKPFTRQQYRECARLCRSLQQQYPAIDTSRIVGHQDIAPRRKWDPGEQWQWSHFRRSMAHIKHTIKNIR